MSPPEVWGPAIWTLFHTLAEKVTEQAYPSVKVQLFGQIRRICTFLPCPECSADATNFLAKVNINDLKTKVDFRNTFYLFHNMVNSKKRKPLFNYSLLASYNNYGLVPVINNFISKYNTKGNMKLLAESFQRKFILSDFKSWITKTIRAFTPPQNVPFPLAISIVEEESTVTTEDAAVGLCCGRDISTEETVTSQEIITTEEITVTEDVAIQDPITEEVVSDETVTEETPVAEEVVSESTVTEEIPVTEEVVSEATVTEEVVSEEVVVTEETVSTEEVVVTEETPITEETVAEEVISEATVIEETAVAEEVVIQPKSKKGKKSKK